MLKQEFADHIECDRHRLILWIAIGARRNQRESNALTTIACGKGKAFLIACREEPFFTLTSSVPDRPNGVNDKLGWEPVSVCDDSVTGLTRTDGATLVI